MDVHASSFIVVHNHPSGDATPSRMDILETQKLNHIANLIGLTLHDHFIVTKESYTSLRSLGYVDYTKTRIDLL
ncbi:hypothetical protein AGMMS50296_5640 [Alphaproteobacteria bacterium]|nr:hypothetical protein AGMMS50296_5640 [Alphaproteobacteria bacterium]